MERIMFLYAVLVLFTLSNSSYGQFTKPEQMHIAFGADPMNMTVVWSTMNKTEGYCTYGIESVKEYTSEKATRVYFIQSPTSVHSQYIYRVTLIHLKPATLYKYQCGDGKNMSDVFSFRSMNTSPTFAPNFAVYGDLGHANDQSLSYLKQDVVKGEYDAILHVGDFAYDMNTDDGKIGDDFMRDVEPLAAFVPYMTCPGNHEGAFNFSNYKNRFSMPGDEMGRNMFYSFDIGPAHIISISTEYYFFWNEGLVQMPNQYHWLEKDLEAANKNRDKVPWIITMGHRPMYCSNSDKDDCTHFISLVRHGIPVLKWWNMEKLFFEQGVDLALWAHEHSYERLFPIYNDKVMNGTKGPYINPGAPVHIVTGSAGCQERHDNFKNRTAGWSAFHSDDYGYSQMKIYNKTHLHIQQRSIDKGGQIIDEMWFVQETHGKRKHY